MKALFYPSTSRLLKLQSPKPSKPQNPIQKSDTNKTTKAFSGFFFNSQSTLKATSRVP